MRLSGLFSDHAVLQRGIAVPVWGWTKPKTRVRVALGGRTAETLSGIDGKFIARLPPMKAGGPFTLEAVAAGGGGQVVVKDVMVGEVWLASGQSNMQWGMSMIGERGDQEARSPDDALRMINIPNEAQACPLSDVKCAWMTASTVDMPNFSAVGYFFAKRLRRELGVPVGIINSSWGGTIVEAWTSREALVRNPDTKDWTLAYEAEVNSSGFWRELEGVDVFDPQERNRKAVAYAFPEDPGNDGVEKGWAKPDLSDSDWPSMNLPRGWQMDGHNFSGVFWFRKEVSLPKEWAGKDLRLRIGAVDKQDTSYFNGEMVGKTGEGLDTQYWNRQRDYLVPGRLVKAGKNLIAVRAYSFAYQGGLIGPADKMVLALADDSGTTIPLAGDWRYKVERDFGLVTPPTPPMGPGNPNSPYILYDSMIAPLIPYALKGAIWYQGESNAERHSSYQRMLTSMIRCWRHAWGVGDFPFIMVQLANYMAPADYQESSSWARLRDAQLKTLAEPGVGMAVAIDIGEALDIHPKNKADVGGRLAQWALAKAYGLPIIPAGPLYAGLTIEGDSLRIHFENAAGGLVLKGGGGTTFRLAGSDKVFHPAEVVVDGSSIVVRCGDISNPLAARYAWADNPDGVLLYNAEGLPASPFRTDNW